MATKSVATTRGKTWAQMKGCSMSPTIESDEAVEVDTTVTWFDGPGIYLTAWRNFEPSAVYPRQVPAFRRLDYIDGELHSIPDNPLFPPFKVNVEDLLIGGKAVTH